MKRRMIQLGRYGVCYFFMLCSIGCSRLSDQLEAQKRKHTAFTAASSNAVSRSGRQRDSNRTAIFTWGTFLRVLMLESVLQAGPTTTYGQNLSRNQNVP
ncbi:hypothetical protein [Candidatus Cardinium hertigii]|uniref:Uncharacterized protein n=1 Tax=Candidatus Cardinium hertigii TaxID=247481 RepID=A0A2Z3LII0_9BACT|nr:hypothetical protein [Candidatus Cardinium hertigii]AWN82254.1 hypothetical protein DK880_00957 [Candidatus Cardinium hertigii]